MKNIIFDLDLTLVDTTILEPYRHNRDWRGAYANIYKCSLYPGIQEVFDFIRANGITVCIVSTSPRPYIENICRHFNIPANFIVGYHDAKPIKPAAEPMIKALELMHEDANNVVSFGDRAMDIQSARAAGIEAVACLWGTKELYLLKLSNPNSIINSPLEIISFL